LKGGVMKLGPISPNTCPECHGVLVKIQQGSILRFRCHTGHSFSIESLLADVNQEIDTTLWSAVRAIEERILLLEEMRRNLKKGDKEISARAVQQAKDAEQYVQKLRDILLKGGTLGHTPSSAGTPKVK